MNEEDLITRLNNPIHISQTQIYLNEKGMYGYDYPDFKKNVWIEEVIFVKPLECFYLKYYEPYKALSGQYAGQTIWIKHATA